MRFQSISILHRRESIAKLLLTVLLVRALVPAGFMPVVDTTGALTFGFCPGTIHAQLVADSDVHAHHGHAPETPTAPTEPYEQQPLCQFAASSSPSLPAVHSMVLVHLVARAPAARIEVATVARPSIIRAQSPRAPPGHPRSPRAACALA
jgi:hypothetical protein